MLQDKQSGEGRHTNTPMSGKLAIFARGITNNAQYSVLIGAACIQNTPPSNNYPHTIDGIE